MPRCPVLPHLREARHAGGANRSAGWPRAEDQDGVRRQHGRTHRLSGSGGVGDRVAPTAAVLAMCSVRHVAHRRLRALRPCHQPRAIISPHCLLGSHALHALHHRAIHRQSGTGELASRYVRLAHIQYNLHVHIMLRQARACTREHTTRQDHQPATTCQSPCVVGTSAHHRMHPAIRQAAACAQLAAAEHGRRSTLSRPARRNRCHASSWRRGCRARPRATESPRRAPPLGLCARPLRRSRPRSRPACPAARTRPPRHGHRHQVGWLPPRCHPTRSV